MMNIKEKRLKENLEYLKLSYCVENYEKLGKKTAEKQLTHIDFLELLIEGEAIEKRGRAVQRRLRNAKLPLIKTLQQYQWSHPKINRMQVENLFRLNFIEKKENVIFIGGPGLGKSHLSLALAKKACEEGYSTLFTGAIDIINNLTSAKAAYNLEVALKKYISPQLLVIDELGYLPIDNTGSDLLFQVITKRYEQGSIILSSNRSFKDWGITFNNDNVIASALLDRLLHHSEVVVIDGESYRMKDK